MPGVALFVIVYGDPSASISGVQLLASLREAFNTLDQDVVVGEDLLRALLIYCGQVEQAVEDWLSVHPEVQDREEIGITLRRVTEGVAALFVAQQSGTQAASNYSPYLTDLAALLERVVLPPQAELLVKLPEGFAFYTLFPEQYVTAARRWHQAQQPNREPALVVGVRSAGTTLSAVVAAELSRLGWPVRRITVRPYGHPFQREVELPVGAATGVRSALVVDEGPGLSGSSMAAVGRALSAAGVPAESIAFLPGHGGEPGAAASEEVLTWWRTTPRYQVPLDELCWPEGDLQRHLACATEAMVPDGGAVVRVDDLSWGLWRTQSFTEVDAWPAAALPFERSKYRCQLADGRSILWKFEGLATFGARGLSGAEQAALQLARLAQERWTPAPLGTRAGFVATPWIDGVPCDAARNRSPELLHHLGSYIVACSGPTLTAEDEARAHERLRELLYWNTWEALGPEQAEAAGRWADRMGQPESNEPAYGDGRMAPWEWLLVPGRVLKLDAAGHAYDHTAVGVQSVLWDLAGVVVEWELDGAEQAALLEAYSGRGGVQVEVERLAFYQACYAAFRAGVMHLCMGSAPDVAERARAEAAYGRYRNQLLRLVPLAPR